jgi:hypothetical protein
MLAAMKALLLDIAELPFSVVEGHSGAGDSIGHGTKTQPGWRTGKATSPTAAVTPISKGLLARWKPRTARNGEHMYLSST